MTEPPMRPDRHDDERAEEIARKIRALDVAPSPRLRAAVLAAVAEAQDAQEAQRQPVPAAAPQRPGRLRRLRAAFAGGRRRLALAGGGVAALAVLVLLLVVVLPGGGSGGGAGAPTVRQVAAAALRPVGGPPPAAAEGGRLDVSGDGIAFPDWSAAASGGWRATGSRAEQVGDRGVTTVAYANTRGEQVGYAIAAAPALPPGGRYVMQNGVPMWVYRLADGATAVMWLRDGRTCVVAGHRVPEQTLLRLAARET